MSVISKKYDFSVLFDVSNGNPNGDPDTGNMPRIDAETNIGIVTDVCMKRKIRNYIELEMAGVPNYAMYISPEQALAATDIALLAQKFPNTNFAGADSKKLKDIFKNLKASDPDLAKKIRNAAVTQYYDVRAFGAVMTTYQGINAAQIRGPVQFGFAHSIDPVMIQPVAITRCVHTTEEDQEKKEGSGTIGRKYVVPYGLYRADGYVSAALAEKYSQPTGIGFSDEDLELLWKAIMNMFEEDRSAGRGNMAVRKLFIFEHNSKMGSAPSHKLFESVHVWRKPDVDTARSFDDYTISIDPMPAGVTLTVRD